MYRFMVVKRIILGMKPTFPGDPHPNFVERGPVLFVVLQAVIGLLIGGWTMAFQVVGITVLVYGVPIWLYSCWLRGGSYLKDLSSLTPPPSISSSDIRRSLDRIKLAMQSPPTLVERIKDFLRTILQNITNTPSIRVILLIFAAWLTTYMIAYLSLLSIVEWIGDLWRRLWS